ncbi:hypothetical protein Tco_0065772 [Tanacetum coccineum]
MGGSKASNHVNGKQEEKFIWEHVIWRFGVPQTITLKDEKQFTEGIFSDFCKGTLPRNSQKETPFILTYGSEAIIPKITHLAPEEEKSLTQEMTEKRKDEEKEVALIKEA